MACKGHAARWFATGSAVHGTASAYCTRHTKHPGTHPPRVWHDRCILHSSCHDLRRRTSAYISEKESRFALFFCTYFESCYNETKGERTMNNALAHTGSSFPTIALKSDGGILIFTSGDPYDGDEEVTRTDIRVPSEPDTDKDGWVDGMTLFALILTFIGFCGMVAQDMGEKAAAREARVRLDQNCMLTYK